MNFSSVLPGWPCQRDENKPLLIGVMTGEGVGMEVVPIAIEVLERLVLATGKRIEIRYGGDIGTTSTARHGNSLTDEVVAFCKEVFSAGGLLFCGPAGDRFVYNLRACFDLYCKFTPLRPLKPLADTGPLRPEILQNVDIIALRENTGGLYMGEWGQEASASGEAIAYQRFAYREQEIDRVLDAGVKLAQQRRGRLTITTKPGGVPSISALWDRRARHFCGEAKVDLQVLEIDNAAYQLIAKAGDFDVIVSPNMFGDIMADCGALLLGSRGMSYSGNFGIDGVAVFQTGHGAAHDLAGTDRANPVGQILSLAMLLREGFMWEAGALAVEAAVIDILSQGYRTQDIAGPGSRVVGTRELGRRICDAVTENRRNHGARVRRGADQPCV